MIIVFGIGIPNRLRSYITTRHGGHGCYCSITFDDFVVLGGIFVYVATICFVSLLASLA